MARPLRIEFPGFLCQICRLHPGLIILLGVLVTGCGLLSRTPAVGPETPVKIEVSCDSSGCHPSIREKSLLHQPVVDGRCGACHVPLGSYRTGKHDMASFHVYTDQKEVCFPCHEDTSGKIIDQKSIHRPVLSGKCTACHDPHGSHWPKLLKKYVAYDPHRYPYPPMPLLKLCADCHSKEIWLEEDYEETGFRDGKSNLHFVHVNQKKGRSCRACHLPHAAPQEKLMREWVPFGTGGWKLPVKYTKTEHGGTCVVGCHREQHYDRRGSSVAPIDNSVGLETSEGKKGVLKRRMAGSRRSARLPEPKMCTAGAR